MSTFTLLNASCADQTADVAGESAKHCSRAYKKFIQDYQDYDIKVMLCAYSFSEYQAAKAELGV